MRAPTLGVHSVLAASLLALALPAPARAATISVPSGVADLATAISQANPGDLIELAGGTYDTVGFTGLTIDKPLHLRGVGGPGSVIIDVGTAGGGTWLTVMNTKDVIVEGMAVLSATSATVRIQSSQAVFRDMIIRFAIGGSGAGARIEMGSGMPSDVGFEYVVFANNNGLTNGAAVYTEHGNLGFHNCDFIQNHTDPVTAAGAVAYIGEGYGAQFRNCLFFNNFFDMMSTNTAGSVFLAGPNSFANFQYCPLQGGLAMVGGNATAVAAAMSTNTITYANPGLNPDFTLPGASPLLNAGDPATIPTLAMTNVGALPYLPTLCGDGVQSAGEQCDDGNMSNGDGCDSCVLNPAPVCGNGSIEWAEECDDGMPPMSGDGCSATCQVDMVVPPVCPNGIMEMGEACDDGDDNVMGDGCTACVVDPGFMCMGTAPSVCTPTGGCVLLNGVLEGPEQCDDGDDSVLGDGCTACATDPGFMCVGQPSVCTLMGTCGNGILEAGELCDDGADIPGDGCTSCNLDFGYQCSGEPSSCVAATGPGDKCAPLGEVPTACGTVCGAALLVFAGNWTCDSPNVLGAGCSVPAECVCGCAAPPPPCTLDGVKEGAEECDDGSDITPGDGCTACVIDPGFMCVGTNPSVCMPTGPQCLLNGMVGAGEQCDDGNDMSPADGCTGCLIDPGFTCMGTNPSVCVPTGPPCVLNGMVGAGEQCDDGNDMSPGDGCTACVIDPGFMCMGTNPSVCMMVPPAVCGNAVLEFPENCDDGDTMGGDGCDASCNPEQGWMCDFTPGSISTCMPFCGDGMTIAPETCDDGPGQPMDGDGCSATCQTEVMDGGVPDAAVPQDAAMPVDAAVAPDAAMAPDAALPPDAAVTPDAAMDQDAGTPDAAGMLPDQDNDGVPDPSDNCLGLSNSDQANQDGDPFGDACDPDADGDGIPNAVDNCPSNSNSTQQDRDLDGKGTPCDDDGDPRDEGLGGGFAFTACSCAAAVDGTLAPGVLLAGLLVVRLRRRNSKVCGQRRPGA